MLRELTRALRDASNLPFILNETVKVVRCELEAEAVSLFLYSKDGNLMELAVSGEAAESILRESYGRSGTVRLAVMSKDDPDRGEPSRGTATNYEWSNPDVAAVYRAFLGNAWCWATVPLDGPNRSFGALRVMRKSRAISDTELSNLVVAATIISLALSHLRRDAELNILEAIQQETAAPNIRINALAQTVAEMLTNEWSDFAAGVIRIANHQNQLELCAIVGAEGIDVDSKSREARVSGGGVVGDVFARNESIVIEDVQRHLDQFRDREWVRKHGFETYACFPIPGFHGAIGTISLFVLYPYRFYDTKKSFIRELGRHLATAIHTHRLLMARNEILIAQRKVAASVHDVHGVLQGIVDTAKELTGATTAYLALGSRRDGMLRAEIAAQGLSLDCIPRVDGRSGGHIARAMSTGAAVNCRDVRGCTGCEASFIDFTGDWAGKIHSELIVPLLYGEQPIGVLSVASGQPAHFADHDVIVAEALAAQAGALVQRNRFFQAASRLEGLPLPRHDRDALYLAIVDAGAKLADVDVAVVAVNDSRKGDPEIVATRLADRVRDIGEPVPLEVIVDERQKYEVVVLPSIAVEVADASLQKRLRQCVDFIVVPLSMRAPADADKWQHFGVLLLGAGSRVSLFDEERQIMSALGRTAAYALNETALLEERDEIFERAQLNAHMVSIAETAAGLAHDNNNRLNTVNTVVGNIRTVVDAHPDCHANGALHDDFDLLERELDVLSKAFLRLNQYTRLQEPNFGWHQLAELLDLALMLAGHRLRKKRIQLKRSLERLPDVYCDRDRVTRVFENLLFNAIDAMKERGRLSVGTSRYADYAEVRVTDDGIGIEEEHKSEIFKPLFTTKKMGTGMGLVVCKEVVEGTHHGRLDFESKRGRGSTFYVRLPLHSPLEERDEYG